MAYKDLDVDVDHPGKVDDLLGIKGLWEVISTTSTWADWKFVRVPPKDDALKPYDHQIGFDLKIGSEEDELRVRMLWGDDEDNSYYENMYLFTNPFGQPDIRRSARYALTRPDGSIVFGYFSESEDDEGKMEVMDKAELVISRRIGGGYEYEYRSLPQVEQKFHAATDEIQLRLIV